MQTTSWNGFGVLGRRISVGSALLWALTPPLAAQTVNGTALTLADAVREADREAFAVRAALAESAASRASARVPLRGILPALRLEAGATRTTDPIGVFSGLLRQRRVTPAAFDPGRLNSPLPLTNVSSGVVVELPLLNADAWHGVAAARAASDATVATGAWATTQARSAVIRAYFGAIVAAERASALDDALGAANATARQTNAMVREGMVTKSDALQANVRVANANAEFIAAHDDARTAAESLALALGRSGGVMPSLRGALPSDSVIRALAMRDTMADLPTVTTVERNDVLAARAAQHAAVADRRRAEASLLPRINSFARVDWNTPASVVGGRTSWTVGVLASWSLFDGGTALADREGARARAVGARVGVEAALARSRLEAGAARRGIASGLQRLELAALADAQGREAARLVQRRYAGGLATIAELLAAESSVAANALSHSMARYALLDAMTTWRTASGATVSDLITLDGVAP